MRVLGIVWSTLVCVALAGCASTPQAPPPVRGEAIGPGMRAFEKVRRQASRDVVRPWESNYFNPGLAGAGVPKSDPQRMHRPVSDVASPLASGPTQATAYLAFRGYKETFSRADGNTCRFSPSCSAFGRDAVREHGLFGVVLTFGRLHKNHQDESFYRLATNGVHLRDPVSNYTFWLRRPALDDFASFDDPAHAWYMHVRAVKRLEHPR